MCDPSAIVYNADAKDAPTSSIALGRVVGPDVRVSVLLARYALRRVRGLIYRYSRLAKSPLLLHPPPKFLNHSPGNPL